MCEFLAVSRRRTRRVGRAEGREFLLAQMCLPGTNDLRSERLGMGPREYHHRDQRRPGRLGGFGLKFYPWRISRDLGG